MDPEQLPLRDLHLPEAIGWWPLAPGWWFLIALAAAGVMYLLFLQFRKWQHNAVRRIALRELARIRTDYEAGMDAQSLAKALSALLRRGMLAYAPRSEVAGLTGDDWLEWLDRGLDDRPFTEGSGRSLETLPYRRPDSIADDVDVAGLIDAVRRRISTPLFGGTG